MADDDPGATSRVRVELGERGYDVVVGSGLLAEVADHVPTGAGRALVVTQLPVEEPYAMAVVDALADAGLETRLETVPDGEAAKTVDVLHALYRVAARMPLGRHDLIVAAGGGAVGDLAGFLAATWNRGIAVLQVPTTVLAQVDAAIGGKTAVNLAEGKNLVGAFHQPVAVVADVGALATLPRREVAAGLAEVVKYGLIRDPAILDTLEADPDGAVAAAPDLMADLVTRSTRVKAAVVAADERETGEREHLNFGHTYGHAVEAASGYTDYRHGEAVAIGMLVALELGARLGITDRVLVDRTRGLVDRLGLPTQAPALDRKQVWRLMSRDKKARDAVRFVLVEGAGQARVVTPGRSAVDAAVDAVEGG